MVDSDWGGGGERERDRQTAKEKDIKRECYLAFQ